MHINTLISYHKMVVPQSLNVPLKQHTFHTHFSKISFSELLSTSTIHENDSLLLISQLYQLNKLCSHLLTSICFTTSKCNSHPILNIHNTACRNSTNTRTTLCKYHRPNNSMYCTASCLCVGVVYAVSLLYAPGIQPLFSQRQQHIN